MSISTCVDIMNNSYYYFLRLNLCDTFSNFKIHANLIFDQKNFIYPLNILNYQLLLPVSSTHKFLIKLKLFDSRKTNNGSSSTLFFISFTPRSVFDVLFFWITQLWWFVHKFSTQAEQITVSNSYNAYFKFCYFSCLTKYLSIVTI